MLERMLRSLVLVMFVVACGGPELAPPPRNPKGECPPKPSCEADTVCELDQARGCEVCKCQSPISK
jgi:hypothetical protein